MANIYNCRPSVLLDLQDPYEAYCFDEACAFITLKMKEGEEPIFPIEKEGEQKHFKKPSDLYKGLGLL